MKTLKRNQSGTDVADLQLRLAGFRGSTWDGQFGPGTELQVITFQRDYMKDANPDGIVGPKTWKAIEEFHQSNLIDFKSVKCPCGECPGYGQQRFKSIYREGKPAIEAYHHYEYPGIHRAVLHTYQAARFYAIKEGFQIPYLTSGYRCWVNNEQKGRKSTNHMGKALDLDFPMETGEDKKDDLVKCDKFRSLLVDKCGFQIGWSGKNKKALEPSSIAPTWIHMDVRCYESKYLKDEFFVQGDSAVLKMVA